ncbi:MAG: hypothetical protein OXG44_10705 [Gammaproteobacteria bacterium]|nr:hypothetical protein [Gammaproteobacteria bacterium]
MDAMPDNIDYDLFVEDGDLAPGKEWPPLRFDRRDQRFADLDLLRAGLWPSGVDLGDSPVSVNVFSAYAIRLANLLLMSEPEADASVEPDPSLTARVGLRNPFIDVCYDVLYDMVSFGGAVMVRIGSGIAVADPKGWYPGADGSHYLTETELDAAAPDASPDRHNVLLARIVDPQSETMTVQRYQWHDGTLGPMLSSEDAGDVTIEIVPRSPRRGVWGTSKFTLMYSPALEISRRYSRNSQILNLYSGPIPVFTQADVDARVRFGVLPSDSETEAQQKILKGQLGIVSEETISIPDSQMSISYLQPNVQGTNYALTQVTDLREHIRDVTGLPDLTGQTVSGDALKRLFIHFYAETSALQNDVRLALERLLDTTVVWPHIFDSDMFSAPALGPPDQPADPDPNPEGDMR